MSPSPSVKSVFFPLLQDSGEIPKESLAESLMESPPKKLSGKTSYSRDFMLSIASDPVCHQIPSLLVGRGAAQDWWKKVVRKDGQKGIKEEVDDVIPSNRRRSLESGGRSAADESSSTLFGKNNSQVDPSKTSILGDYVPTIPLTSWRNTGDLMICDSKPKQAAEIIITRNTGSVTNHQTSNFGQNFRQPNDEECPEWMTDGPSTRFDMVELGGFDEEKNKDVVDRLQNISLVQPKSSTQPSSGGSKFAHLFQKQPDSNGKPMSLNDVPKLRLSPDRPRVPTLSQSGRSHHPVVQCPPSYPLDYPRISGPPNPCQKHHHHPIDWKAAGIPDDPNLHKLLCLSSSELTSMRDAGVLSHSTLLSLLQMKQKKKALLKMSEYSGYQLPPLPVRQPPMMPHPLGPPFVNPYAMNMMVSPPPIHPIQQHMTYHELMRKMHLGNAQSPISAHRYARTHMPVR